MEDHAGNHENTLNKMAGIRENFMNISIIQDTEKP